MNENMDEDEDMKLVREYMDKIPSKETELEAYLKEPPSPAMPILDYWTVYLIRFIFRQIQFAFQS